MAAKAPGRLRGISRLEFALIVSLVGVLALALLSRLLETEREAERLEVALTVRNIGVGLKLAVSERIMRGQEERLAELLERNPVDFLDHRPRGYGTPPGTPGRWAFDARTRVLSYQTIRPEAFAGKAELRWQIQAFVATRGRPAGLRLVPLEDDEPR
ncbi:MAG TPA: hypothetical protein VI279_13660 [Rhodocyclaceae bacterium]